MAKPRRAPRHQKSKKNRPVARTTLSSQLAAIMRGNPETPDLLADAHRLIRLFPQDRLEGLNRFIAKQCFALRPGDYGTSLRFTPRQIDQLAQLRQAGPTTTEENWLYLAVTYILENLERVRKWIEFDTLASVLLIREEPDKIKEALLELPSIDLQSPFSMRLYASLHPYSDSAIREYVNSNLTSHWVKSRLLYPLIYYAINLPSQTALSQMLDHLVPSDKLGRSERQLISFILCPQDDLDVSLSYRCYVGLMAHPYDALEYITQYLEMFTAQRKTISKREKTLVTALAEALPEHRIAKLNLLQSGGRFEILKDPTLVFEFMPSDAVAEELSQMMDAGRSEPDIQHDFPILRALRSLRWNLYPVKADFDIISSYRFRFAMLSAGVFIDWFSRSLFLFIRDEYLLEELWVFRGALMCGGLPPLLLMGPHGPAAIDGWSNVLAPGASSLRTSVEDSFGDGKGRIDRLWISAANWSISQHQRNGKLQDWAQEARHTFPVWVEPKYLSGLDWRWLSDVISEVGVLPFRGQPNGVYVLFLRQLEENLREYTALRLALEPIVSRGDPEGLFNWLADEFGQDALAIVRIVLLPDTNLKLRLADNYTAALTARLALLEACVKRFGFVDGFLSETDLAREALALTASLSRMSLGARQFELPWDTLKEAAITRNQFSYDAYETMLGAVSDSSAVTNTRRASTYPYSNGAVGEYEARNREWPLILTIAGIIDTFLSHPTGGMEAILSVRIRHDAFRRELVNAVQEVSRAPIPGVLRATIQRVAEAAELTLSREVNSWLDARMHTLRKGKEEAFFNFVPTRQEMTDLVAITAVEPSFEDIVDRVLEWVQPKLEGQLCTARHALEFGLGTSLQCQLQIIEQNADPEPGRPTDVATVAHAVATAIERRLKSLDEWFRIPETVRDRTLTLQEIYLAVQHRFQPKGRSGNIVFGALPTAYEGRIVSPEHIRHMYDLLSELVQNAVKHGGRRVVRLRFTALETAGQTSLVISNPCNSSIPRITQIEGHPYETVHDTLFGEGNTGTKKVAYLAASIIKRPVSTVVESRRRSFHVAVPLEIK
jgi:hypothetical protein